MLNNTFIYPDGDIELCLCNDNAHSKTRSKLNCINIVFG